VKIRHIVSGNDGDVCIAMITEALLKKTDVPYCIDIGVDQGWWSLFVLDTNTKSQIVAFEPNPISYAALKACIESESRITLYPFAISDKKGTIPFVIEGGNSNSRDASATLSVACVKIDKYIDRPVTLMKIDTEGHEIHILKTLRPHFKNIESIIFEFTVYWYHSVDEAKDELKNLLAEYPVMCMLNRRGLPSLERIGLENIDGFITFCIENRFQCDILCSRSPVFIRTP
jgi:FkbM family methyltransferase